MWAPLRPENGSAVMRRFPFIGLLVLLSALPVRAQTTQSASGNDGLSCFVNAPAPEYPRAAIDEHVDGSVWTWTTVTSQGTIDKIDSEVVSAWSKGPKLLAPPVEKAIHEAKIKPECAGRKIWVVFRYDLHGDATPTSRVTSRAERPNIIWIESQPGVQPELSSARH